MQSALFLEREGVDIIYWTGPLGSKFQGWSEPSELLILCQCTRSGLFVDHLTTIGAKQRELQLQYASAMCLLVKGKLRLFCYELTN